MKRIFKFLSIVLFLAIAAISNAQHLTKAEYFFDTDPGVGHATALTMGTHADSVVINQSISTNGLTAGFHTLFVRFRDSLGVWGLSEGRTFFLNTTVNLSAAQLSKAEYFIDTDPGPGQGHAITVSSAADSLTLTPAIATTSLSAGFHNLFVRFKDVNGSWGLSESRTFFLSPPANVSAAQLKKAEYFIDTDPGLGLGHAITVASAADSLTLTPAIATTSLSAGFHNLYVRFKDANGIWGLTESRTFFLNPPANVSAAQLKKAEYFIDTDPGVGNGHAITVASAADSLTLAPAIATTSLSAGFHNLYVRFKDANGIWGLSEGRTFFLNAANPSAAQLNKAEYFINTDPGIGRGHAITVTQGDSITLNNSSIPTAGLGLGVGTDTLYVRFRDLNGVWSIAEGRAFQTCAPPAAPTASSTTICKGTSTLLSATGTATLGWYSAATGGIHLGSGSTYQTPILTADTAYYVQDSACAASTRTAVKVKINAPVVIANATANTLCTGSALTLTGSGTATSYNWGIGITNGVSFQPSATKTYTVTGIDSVSTCSNTATVTVTVNITPTVTATATAYTVCKGTAVKLTGGGTANTAYAWSGGITNGTNFTPQATNTYTVTGTSTNSCSAITTTTIVVNNLPIVTAPAASTVCTNARVTLSGAGADSYNWTGGVTNGVSFAASATKTYTVTGTDTNNCSSTAVTKITISSNTAPTVTSNLTAQTICLGTAITLTASGTATSYSWSNGVTNGVNFVPVASNTYTLTGIGANGCSNSATSAITVNNLNAMVTEISIDSAIANVSGGTMPYTYSWNTIPIQTGMIATSLSAGTSYTVTIRDAIGCSTKSSVLIVAPHCTNVNLAFSANPTSNPAPLPVNFTNTTPNRSLYNFTWYWGDGTSSSDNSYNVSHTYQNTGVYDVALVAVKISSGCTDTLIHPSMIFASGANCTQTATITSSNASNNGCYGDTIVLSANTDPSFSYNWNINGTLISGANSSTLAVTQSGYYSVTIIKNNCSATSTSKHVVFANPLQKPSIRNTGSIASCTGGTITLLASAYNNAVNYLWSNGQTSSSIAVNTSGVYSVTVTDVTSGCSSSSVSDTVNASVGPATQICLVTVDTLSAQNIISWQKPSTQAIRSFKIYREVTTNNYTSIATIPYDSLSEYNDAGANPNVTQYRYRMSAIDTCGNETSFSRNHLTIHLQINSNGNLSWNLYEIENTPNPVNFFIIERSDSYGAPFHAISSTVPGGNTSYTDVNYASYPNAAYRVSTQWNISCTPTRSSARDLNTSYSNESPLRTASPGGGGTPGTGINKVSDEQLVTVAPNPAHNTIEVSYPQGVVSIEIYDALGQLVVKQNTNADLKQTLDISVLDAGFYTIRFIGNNSIISKKIITY